MKPRLWVALTAAGLGAGALWSQEGTSPPSPVDAHFRAGQEKSMQCVACHGAAGISTNPMFPHLAGQHAAYLEAQLDLFQTGERYHPLMTPVAQSLSRRDIQELVTYYSRVGPLAANAAPTESRQ